MNNGIANLADIQNIENQTPKLAQSTYEVIGATALAHPKAPALSFFARSEDYARPEVLDYETLFGQITATANFFHELGVGKDDVVAFVLPNLPETHLTIWGGQAAGIVLAINPLLEPAAIAELLCAGGARVLVTLAPFPGVDLWARLEPVLRNVSGLRDVVLVDLAPGAHRLCAAVPAGVNVHRFAEGVGRQPRDRLLSGRMIRSGDVSSYFCTGGTTGTPKIAMRTHGNEVANAWSIRQVLGERNNGPRTIFCGLPLFHVNAVLVTGLEPFSRGDHVILGTPQGYRGDGVIARFWDIVAHHRITAFSGVPTLYGALLQQPIGGRDISSLEFGVCGAAPMPMELMREFQKTTGLKILEGYGLTEGTCVSTINPPRGEQRIGSIGLRVPLQLMKAIVLDGQGAYVRDCDVDEAGVLVISGPNVFLGYRVAKHNEGLWLDLGDGRRWLNTGDLGRQDAEGYFYLTGRKKELIIRGGHNIDPASIEEPLHAHPAVQIAAAVGRPDAHAGELPVAYVQLRPGAMTTEADLLAFAKEAIRERAALPKAIRIIDVMPLTGVGKIFKPALKHREIADALRCALQDAGVGAVDLEVLDDPQQGICIGVSPSSDDDVDRLIQVLGQYPFVVRVAASRQSP